MAPLEGSDRCFTHAVDQAPARARARRRGGQATRTPSLFPLPAEPSQLRDVVSVQTLLEEVVHQTRAQPNSAQRSRTIAVLLGVALRTLEIGELESRIQALEERLSTRNLRRA
jgi:tRNA U34 5-methylaminomethyl-2-thiouridine-forming methyltransferase MnmC